MHEQKAAELFEQNHNCAQAVLGAFAEELGLPLQTALLLSSSLGGGIGHSGDICGAVLGMCMAAGLAFGYDTPAQENKKLHADRIKKMMDTFREQYQHTKCAELKVPGDRSFCAELVQAAARIADEAMQVRHQA